MGFSFRLAPKVGGEGLVVVQAFHLDCRCLLIGQPTVVVTAEGMVFVRCRSLSTKKKKSLARVDWKN